jgi:hypothetical protein
VMRVELPGESKSFADIKTGECFAVTRDQVTSVCMKVDWLSSDSIAVLWSASYDWTVPHLIAPTELRDRSFIRCRARSSLHHLTQKTFVLGGREMSTRPVSSLRRPPVNR